MLPSINKTRHSFKVYHQKNWPNLH